MNPDLEHERNNSSFRSEELTPFLLGETKMAIQKKLLPLITNNPAFKTENLWYMTRDERYLQGCSRAEELVRLIRKYHLIEDEEAYSVLELLTGEDFFLMLHLTMFLPCLKTLCNETQALEWIPLAKDFRIIGTYAQTELAHGSNVAALQTIADLDVDTDEWIMNTPTLNAIKWWPGGLAKSANCCILMARLRIKKIDYGVHAFFFPVRDFNSHQVLPGIHLFDIGQKMGYNAMDNGAMQLNNVRIPRHYLLQKYVTVDKDGIYRQLGNTRMMYATMTYTRKQIIIAAGPSLAKACTIAIRYSAVRRQFPKLNEILPTDLRQIGHLEEAQVLDYSTQQFALLPYVATAIGFTYAADKTNELYNKMLIAAKQNDFSRLNDMHLLTSALKGTMTSIASEGIEMCRKALGGHGYLLSSGIPLHYTSYVAQATYEGDFVVLSIQCGRSFLRILQKKLLNPEYEFDHPVDSPQRYVIEFDPLAEYPNITDNTPINFHNLTFLCNIFKRRTCMLIYLSAQRMSLHLASGLSPLAALDEEKIAFTRISKAHCHAVVLSIFYEKVEQAKNSPVIYKILSLLMTLYGTFWADQSYAEFIAAGVVTSHHHNELMLAIKQILKELRPEAVSIVDAWGFSDAFLNSTLGKFDGNVYQALYDATKLEPLNKQDITEGYYRHIQYILHPERKLSSFDHNHTERSRM